MKDFRYFIQSLRRNRNNALKVLTTASSHIRPYSHLNHPVIHSMLYNLNSWNNVIKIQEPPICKKLIKCMTVIEGHITKASGGLLGFVT
jgi:hypothetical protein